MARKDQQRTDVGLRLKEHLLNTGLSRASLRQLATAAGVSDRMLLYYFDDKADALNTAFGLIAADLTLALDMAVPEGTTLSMTDLIRTVTDLTLAPDTKPYFRLWTEAIAGVLREPEQFEQIVKLIASGFLTWIEARLEGGTPESRQADAAMILAMIDGLALLEICTDEATARLAAERMKQGV
ncbi:MAG: TetR/AcrR family transcriptional regulator [Pseudomonadota bacterium]